MMTRRASAADRIVVPGSISNLGPALDTLAVAVRLYVEIRVIDVRPSAPDTLDMRFADGGPGGENRIATAFWRARERIGVPAPGLVVEVESQIPRRAGLGSSGAATVAGLRLYEAMTARRADADWLALACEMEGHPDNAAAALLRGMTTSCQQENGRVTARVWRWPSAIRFVVATPAVPLDTSSSRAVLPPTVGLADAVFNLQRALLFVRALETGDYEDVREGLRDRWHQPSRASLVPGLSELLALDHPSILGVCLSGSGPSVVALTTGSPARVGALMRDVYRRLNVPCAIRALSADRPESDNDESNDAESNDRVASADHVASAFRRKKSNAGADFRLKAEATGC
jgi:homoserine kinase